MEIYIDFGWFGGVKIILKLVSGSSEIWKYTLVLVGLVV